MEAAARNGDFIGGFGLLTPRTKLLVLSLLAAAISVLTFYSPLVPPLRTLDEPYAGEGSRFSSSPLGFNFAVVWR